MSKSTVTFFSHIVTCYEPSTTILPFFHHVVRVVRSYTRRLHLSYHKYIILETSHNTPYSMKQHLHCILFTTGVIQQFAAISSYTVLLKFHMQLVLLTFTLFIQWY